MRSDELDGTVDAALRARLQHVYWIGGGSGAGKSTIARRIAAQHGFRTYVTGEVMPDHANRSTPDDAPYLSGFKTMDMDERWANRTPEVMLGTFHWFRGEGFGMIVEDLLHLSAETGMIVEGFQLLPHHNLLECDRMFTDHLSVETKRLDLPVIEIDTDMTEDELADRVTRLFGL